VEYKHPKISCDGGAVFSYRADLGTTIYFISGVSALQSDSGENPENVEEHVCSLKKKREDKAFHHIVYQPMPISPLVEPRFLSGVALLVSIA